MDAENKSGELFQDMSKINLFHTPIDLNIVIFHKRLFQKLKFTHVRMNALFMT